MKVHVYGKPGTLKPVVANWIARRYGLDPAVVTAGEEPRRDVDLNVLCVHELDRGQIASAWPVVPYAILLPAIMNELLDPPCHPDHVLGQQLDRLFQERFGMPARPTQAWKE